MTTTELDPTRVEEFADASGSAPHQTDYVGVPQFGGTWFALSASGRKVG